jgi:hypothetical protein
MVWFSNPGDGSLQCLRTEAYLLIESENKEDEDVDVDMSLKRMMNNNLRGVFG